MLAPQEGGKHAIQAQLWQGDWTRILLACQAGKRMHSAGHTEMQQSFLPKLNLRALGILLADRARSRQSEERT